MNTSDMKTVSKKAEEHDEERDLVLGKSLENNLISIKHPAWLSSFISVYQTLTTNNLDDLAKVYHENVIFIDPLHEVKGYPDLHAYFVSMYMNLTECKFMIYDVISTDDSAAIYWNMTFTHVKLNGGESITVTGSSHLKGSKDKVIYHRDYIDLGAMIYEQIPLLKRVILAIKNRVL